MRWRLSTSFCVRRMWQKLATGGRKCGPCWGRARTWRRCGNTSTSSTASPPTTVSHEPRRSVTSQTVCVDLVCCRSAPLCGREEQRPPAAGLPRPGDHAAAAADRRQRRAPHPGRHHQASVRQPAQDLQPARPRKHLCGGARAHPALARRARRRSNGSVLLRWTWNRSG